MLGSKNIIIYFADSSGPSFRRGIMFELPKTIIYESFKYLKKTVQELQNRRKSRIKNLIDNSTVVK